MFLGPEIHFGCHKSPPSFPIRSQAKQLHILTPSKSKLSFVRNWSPHHKGIFWSGVSSMPFFTSSSHHGSLSPRWRASCIHSIEGCVDPTSDMHSLEKKFYFASNRAPFARSPPRCLTFISIGSSYTQWISLNLKLFISAMLHKTRM